MHITNFQSLNSKRSERYGFLHIGKTAGSAVTDLLNYIESVGFTPPAYFMHDWILAEIVDIFPAMQISIIIRDPIERMISGFESRKRMGRPRYNNPWSTEEAIAFSYFSSAKQMFTALCGTDDRLKSAALFAVHNILHVKRGYQYHFRSLDFLQKHIGKFYAIIPFDSISNNIYHLFAPCNIPPVHIKNNFTKAHVNPHKNEEKYTQALNSELLLQIRKYFAEEYKLYDYLLSISNHKLSIKLSTEYS